YKDDHKEERPAGQQSCGSSGEDIMSAIGIDTGLDLATAGGRPDEISRRLESLPASSHLWRLVILLSLGGCFEIYDLFFTGYTAATVAMACQTTSGGLLLWRFIAGIGIGVEIITIDAYITELVPSWMRGRAFAVNQAVMFIAVPVVAFLSWWLVPLQPYGVDGWRWVVLIGAAGSMVIWV